MGNLSQNTFNDCLVNELQWIYWTKPKRGGLSSNPKSGRHSLLPSQKEKQMGSRWTKMSSRRIRGMRRRRINWWGRDIMVHVEMIGQSSSMMCLPWWTKVEIVFIDFAWACVQHWRHFSLRMKRQTYSVYPWLSARSYSWPQKLFTSPQFSHIQWRLKKIGPWTPSKMIFRIPVAVLCRLYAQEDEFDFYESSCNKVR